ncbi:hypothetical protein DF147_21720 [Burkholderia cenocepacia]|nr:hypothetical protein DF147_21720 [Burkholderia cenocepacia]RQU95109.1 hypothetical protein DF133_03390 [Burkholderia cenocepacia]RQV15424.1 hypothetical protein DF132_28365 [Burkholderia cenocepacia]RQV61123.1 hypothetical protein DF018_28915 [Burkholderia cenocepacia]RQV90661.1 hypothetical protein DF019_06000 [Burkholderia cenocepacia]
MEREIERGIHVVGARVVPAAGHVPVGTHDKGGAVAWASRSGKSVVVVMAAAGRAATHGKGWSIRSAGGR